MKVLVVGSGGREHAICWKLSQSPMLTKLYCAPGNGGIAQVAECVDISATDLEGLAAFAKKEGIDLTVPGMDEPLVLGICDVFKREGLRIYGPSKAAAEIEGSKVFSKAFMKKYGIPTAKYGSFDNGKEAMAYADKLGYPVVVKADGLALGKGVFICNGKEEAQEAVYDMLENKKFGVSGERIVVEEFLTGPEVSVLAFCDGQTVVPMASAQDHKRALDGNEGLNTGGMGTVSPSRHYTDEVAERCMKEIFLPTIRGLEKEGREFMGILFFGLMLTERGPVVIEYNCRFGDPETQSVLLRLNHDLLDIFMKGTDKRLSEVKIRWDGGASCCVILASGGYPEKYNKGYEIKGLDIAHNNLDIMVFHAGTRFFEGKIVTNGGRVLGVCAKGDNLEEALEKAYEYAEKINFTGRYYRKDIGKY